MSENDAAPKTLSDDEILSVKKVNRRSLLASTGLGIVGAVAAAAAVTMSATPVQARDRKNADSDRRDSGNDRD